MPNPYLVVPNPSDKARPYKVVFTLRSYSNGRGTYATEEQAKTRMRKLNRDFLSLA